MTKPPSILSRFRRDERGVFAVLFGVTAIVLVALAGAVVDFVFVQQSRTTAQVALDAATLALQSEITRPGYDEQDIRRRAEALVVERIGNTQISAEIDEIRIDTARGSLFLSGHFSMPTYFVRLVGVEELGARISSEAVRGSLDIEVAVALDITGSMSEGGRIAALRAAALGLIDSVVQDDQSLNYTKMALVPYAQSVNVAPYQTQIRGPERGPVGLSTLSWSTGSAIGVSRATSTASGYFSRGQVLVQSTRHGLSNNQWVYVWNMPQFSSTDQRAFRITNVTRDSFELAGSAEFNWTSHGGGASVIRCERAGCEVLVNSTRHGYNNGDYVYVTDVVGPVWLNGGPYAVASANRDSLILAGSSPAGSSDPLRAHTRNTGRLHCTRHDWNCTYYRFANMAGGWTTFPLTDCVTERATNAATDLPFTTTYAGRNYAGSSNGCITNSIVPLTANKTVLRNAINGLRTNGSTAGHLGIVWAWNMLSPNVGVWSGQSRPAAYDAPHLLKAAIIMSDGEFNTVHCQGVVARNSTSGSGVNGDRINCDAPNGSPYVQARAYCDAMKNTDKIVIFTVGFGLSEGSDAANLLAYCASGADRAFLTDDASGLDAAFQQIASNISALRIAR